MVLNSSFLFKGYHVRGLLLRLETRAAYERALKNKNSPTPPPMEQPTGERITATTLWAIPDVIHLRDADLIIRFI